MTREEAQAALTFLNRVDLKGAEVPAFVEVYNALRRITDAAEPPRRAAYGEGATVVDIAAQED